MSSLARPPACARASLRRSAPRSAAESRAFRKYHGLGNDFVLVRPAGRPPARACGVRRVGACWECAHLP